MLGGGFGAQYFYMDSIYPAGTGVIKVKQVKALLRSNVFTNVNININFNIVFMMTKCKRREWIYIHPCSAFAFALLLAQCKLNANADVDASSAIHQAADGQEGL